MEKRHFLVREPENFVKTKSGLCNSPLTRRIFRCTFIHPSFIFFHRSPSKAFCEAFRLSAVSSVIRFSCGNGTTPNYNLFCSFCVFLCKITRAPTTAQTLIIDAHIGTGLLVKQDTFPSVPHLSASFWSSHSHTCID